MRLRKSYWLLPLLVLSCVFILTASIPNVATGTWQTWNAMGDVRSGAAEALLQNGGVLIIGGTNANGPVASADLFGTDGNFSAAAAMQTPRSGHAATVLSDGRVLVTGGVTTGGGAVNTAEIYDPSADSWSAPTTMVEGRAGHTASVLSDGRVLLAGGHDSAGNALSGLEIFDPASGKFSSAGAMSVPRMNHAAATLGDGRVLIIGGTTDGTNALASIDIYDPSAGTVSAGPALSTPRMSATATTTLDGKVAVIGGNNGSASGSQDLASAEIFDPATGLLSPSASSLTTARSGHQSFLLPKNNAVLVLGGSSAGTDLSSAELYYPWLDSFQSTAAMSVARPGLTGSAVGADGRFLAAGGTGLASTELYGFSTVKTDAADYPPGSTVTITGSGWQPGETVTLTLRESPLIDTPPTMTAVADANGNISNNQFSPDSYDANVRFYLTAVGQTSAFQAQNTFTDSTSFSNPNVGSQSPAGVLGGGSATFPVTVNFNGSGTCTVSLSVLSGLPSGSGSSFSPSSGTGTSSASVLSSTLTVTPPAAATPNSYTFTVRATGIAGNCSGTTKDGTGTLAVSGPATGLQVGGFPSPITAGTSGNFTVTAVDSHGNVAAGYAGTVHFTSSDAAATLPSDYTFTGAGTGNDNGSHTFSATLNTVASNQSITATDAPHSLSGFQNHINVTAPPTVAITVTTSPANLQVSLDGGAAQVAPVTVNWVPGSTHTIATTSPQSGGASTQYAWTNWSDGGALSHTITVPSSATTYTANFKTQYQLTFGQSGLAADATGTIVTVNGGAQSTLPYTAYYDAGSTVTYSYTSPVTSSVSGKQYALTTPAPSPTSGFTVSGAQTITGTYKVQWQVSFAQSGLAADATGTIVTVNGGAQSTLPYTAYYDAGSTVTYSYTSPVTSSVSGKQYALTTPAPSPTSGFTVSGAQTITGTYKVQWQVSFAQSGLAADATGTIVTVNGGAQSTLPYTAYYDAGSTVTYSYTSPVTSSVSGKQYVLTTPAPSPTSGFTVSGAQTVTGTYKVQWQVSFAQSGLAADATGTIVTVNGGAQSTLPYTAYYDAGSTVTYSYTSPVTSSVSGKQYALTTPAPSPTSGFTVSGAQTVTGTYKVQWQVSFAQSGLAADATGTIVTVNGGAQSTLPYTAYYDDGSTVTYSYTSPVTSSVSGKQYALTTPAPSPTSGFTVSGAQTVTGTYKVQWQVSFAQSGLAADATGTIVTVNGGAQSTLPYTAYYDAGSMVTYSYTSPVTSSVSGKQYALTTPAPSPTSGFTVSGAQTITGTYKVQWQVSFAQSGLAADATGTIVTVNGGAQSTLPYTAYYDAGSTVTYSYTSPVTSSVSGKQYVLTTPAPSPASGFTVSGAQIVTGTYKVQWQVSFAQSGLAADATGTIVTVNGGAQSTLPYTAYYDDGSTVTYSYTSPVTSSVSGKQYALTTPAPTPSSGFTVSSALIGANSITGTYKVQWQVSFAQSGLAADATGTIVTVNGGAQSALPYTAYYDAGSTVTYSYTSPVTSSVSGKQYALTTPAPTPSSGFTVSSALIGANSITGTYKVQWQVSFAQSGLAADATGTIVTVNGGAQSALPYMAYYDAGSTVTYSYTSPVTSTVTGKRYILTAPAPSPGSPFTVVAAYTITATYKAQFDTTTTVTSSMNPSLIGQSVTFTATVATVAPGGGTPTGSVQFKLDGSNFGAGVSLSGGAATSISTSTLAVGNHTVEADYTPDTDTYTSSVGMLAGGQTVQYNVCLLYDPTRSVKSGATYPLKLYLCDVNNNDMSSSGIIVHATSIFMISGFTGAPEDAGNANPDSDFRFDATLGPSGGYIFNLQTTGLGGGTYGFTFTASNDPTTHKVLPGFGVK